MFHHTVADWDDAYSNTIHIANGTSWPGLWDAAAECFLATHPANRMQLDLAYGPSPRQTVDLFLPEGPPRGLAIYVHGGYWMESGPKSYFHLAQGALAHGFAFALPGYRLCPEARIAEITAEVAAAIALAAGKVGGPIHLTGHSAGGHLATRMICASAPLAAAIQSRIKHVVSISGVHDLRPLLNTKMNDTLHLDETEARAESPALLRPVPGAKLTCWVGAAERAEFRRQTALLANIWTGLGAETLAVEEPDRHHYNIVDGLASPSHPLTLALLS